MRDRYYVPWAVAGDDDGTAQDIERLAHDVAPHVGMAEAQLREQLYRWAGWLYAMHAGSDVTGQNRS